MFASGSIDMAYRKLSEKHKDFFRDVFDVVREVPEGRVTSYGAIARYLSSGSASRMVGWAMNHSHKAGLDVPAHRVVNRNGYLTGKQHFGAPGKMQELLEKEGIRVEDDQVVEFRQRFWDPMEELG